MDVDQAQVGRTISRLVAENGQLQAEVRRLREENEGLQRNLSMARELDEDAVTYIFRWRKVAESILHTHRSGDVVLLQEDADALANLLGEAP